MKNRKISLALCASLLACGLFVPLNKTLAAEFKSLPKYLKDEAGGKKVDRVELFDTASGRYKFAAFFLKKKNRVDSRIVVFELLRNKKALPNLIWSTSWQAWDEISFQELSDSSYKQRPLVLVLKRDKKGVSGDLFGFEGPEMISLKAFKGKNILLKKGGNEILVQGSKKKNTYRWSESSQSLEKVR